MAFRPQNDVPYQVGISGITVADLPSFAIRGFGVPYVHISGVNLIAGWYFKTDGIVIGEHALVEDTFINGSAPEVVLGVGADVRGQCMQRLPQMRFVELLRWSHSRATARLQPRRLIPSPAVAGRNHVGRRWDRGRG